jgi:cytoskeletal protein CcmA (bactofilin family)
MGKNPEEKAPTQADTDYANRGHSAYQSNDAYRPAPEAVNSSKALTESETIAREIKDGSLSGFVGSGTVITGEASFKSMLRVDGRFSGRINSTDGTLIVGAGGQVDANIEVAIATIHGIVNGDIVATDRIELGRAAKLTGNIQAPSLMIEQGAVFEGTCKMTQAKAAAKEPARIERKDNVIDVTKPAVKPETTTPAKPIVSAVAN